MSSKAKIDSIIKISEGTITKKDIIKYTGMSGALIYGIVCPKCGRKRQPDMALLFPCPGPFNKKTGRGEGTCNNITFMKKNIRKDFINNVVKKEKVKSLKKEKVKSLKKEKKVTKKKINKVVKKKESLSSRIKKLVEKKKSIAQICKLLPNENQTSVKWYISKFTKELN